MSRTIKFRCWNIKEKHWQPFQEWSEAEANAYGLTSGIYGLENDEFFTWSQFTGLTDKKGVEVYEGDIVGYNFYHGDPDDPTADKHTMTIEYETDKARFNTPLSEQDDYPISLESFEVIGNIYENPSLLDHNTNLNNKQPIKEE